MLHKRLMGAGTALVLTAALLAVPASAHGGHHGKTRGAAAPCAVCTTEDCTIIGRHVHDGVAYCGSDHADGFCDGSCVAASTPSAPAVSADTTGGCHGNGHHGCH